MKRSERIAYLTKTLVDAPNQVISLRTFSEDIGASKTSLSEDIDILKRTFHKLKLGYIETIVGAGGGVRYRPHKNPQALQRALQEIHNLLENPARLILNDYLYYGDILFHPQRLQDLALAILSLYPDEKIDGILTIETKGVPLALEVARLLGVRVIVARKTNRVSEGITLSVHYKSMSHNTVQSMYVTKGAITKGSRILIVDDFMKAGGTIAGMKSLIQENEGEVIGSCVFMQELSDVSLPKNHRYLFGLRKHNGALKVEISPEILSIIEFAATMK